MTETDKQFLKLTLVNGIGATTIHRMLARFGSAEKALCASKSELMGVEKIGDKTADSIIESRKSIDIDSVCEKIKKFGAEFISIENEKYPKLLKNIYDSPIGFYMKGDIDFNAPCISIVGSRYCSVYGQSIARKFAYGLAQLGFTIVSGMARGIDSAAHLGALEAKGKTLAVLGSGLDIIYPPENIDLYRRIMDSGAVISEFPLGTRADKQTFPIRNRIIAGISAATIVIESDVRGGSMITARLAGEFGRDVFAVPGRVDSPSSRGCHALIRDGAILASSVEDIATDLGYTGQFNLNFEESSPEPKLDGDEKSIYDALQDKEPHSLDEVAEKTSLPIAKILSVSMMLELKKLVTKNLDGTIQKKF